MYLLLFDNARFYVLNYLTLVFPSLLGLINSCRPAIHHCPLGSLQLPQSDEQTFKKKLVVNVNKTTVCPCFHFFKLMNLY